MSYTLETYDPDEDFDRFYTDATAQRIRERLDATHVTKVLEIGCATGRMTAQLAVRGRDWTRRILAVTLDRGMAERAKARELVGVEVVCGDVLDMKAMEFQAIVCCSVLHEVPAVDKILRKAWELLGPRGRVFVTVPSALSLHFGGEPEMSERARRFGVRRLLTPEEWTTLLITGTGLKVVYRDEMILKPYPQEQMSKLDHYTQAYLARYRGPDGALCFFELEAAE